MNRYSMMKNGFYLAGAANILGVLIFSLGFTNRHISSVYPEVMSVFGLVMIIVWGLVFIAAGYSENFRYLSAVFAIEKTAYVISWFMWILRPEANLSAVFHQSVLSGIFYAVYGANDLLFGIFFIWVFITLSKEISGLTA